jgi:hypothetical protein
MAPFHFVAPKAHDLIILSFFLKFKSTRLDLLEESPGIDSGTDSLQVLDAGRTVRSNNFLRRLRIVVVDPRVQRVRFRCRVSDLRKQRFRGRYNRLVRGGVRETSREREDDKRSVDGVKSERVSAVVRASGDHGFGDGLESQGVDEILYSFHGRKGCVPELINLLNEGSICSDGSRDRSLAKYMQSAFMVYSGVALGETYRRSSG